MKFFKLTKIRRLIILGVTIISAVLAVALGGSLYVSKNAKKGLEYGGGVEYTVQVKTESGKNARDVAADVALSIQDRVDPTGVQGIKVSPENTKKADGTEGAQVRVTVPGLTAADEVAKMQDLITKKPTLTLTDIYGNPLFNDQGHFNTLLNAQITGYVGVSGLSNDIEDIATSGPKSQVPIDQNGAKGTQTNSGEHEVSLNLIPGQDYTTAWTDATKYVAALSSKTGSNEILAWLNYQDFIKMAKDEFPTEWSNAKHDPYKFAHVGESLTHKGADGKEHSNILKDNVFTQKGYPTGIDFMISAASVKQALSGTSFVISGSFSQDEVNDLAKKINFGVAKYSLINPTHNQLNASYGASAFNMAMIAGIVVFAFVAVFLIANYGLLGALSTISIALYIFLILTFFTVMRGEYSPETIAALIIGIGMGVDANIITFERLKGEVYSGTSIKKAFNKSNKQSLTTIFDANITTLIVAFVLFYFGSNSIVGLSVTLILSIVFTLIIMLGFTRFMATMLVNTGVFESRKHWLGLKPKFDVKIQEKVNKFDYIKNAKWFVIGSASIFAIALIVLAITAGLAGSINGGFVLSQDFTGGTAMHIVTAGDASHISGIANGLKGLGIPNGDITKTTATVSGQLQTTFDVHSSHIADLNQLGNYKELTTGNIQNNISNTTSDVATKLVRDAMISIGVAIGLIIIYTMIRFKWTYSIAAIVALIHDGLMVTALFIICRVEISPVFIAGLLSILGYSINDTIVTFDRIREKMNNSMGELTPAKIKTIANDAIKDTFKRSILTSLTTVIAVLILMCFGSATKLSFNLAMLVGLVAGTYSSIFIASYLWVKLEIRRQKRIKARSKNGFWKTDDIEEQTFDGINDFVA